MEKQNIIAKIKKILLEDPEVKEKWNDLISISSFADAMKSFKLLYFFIVKLVYVIEIIQTEFGVLNKEEKIEYASAVLDDVIVFKGWALWLEAIDYTVFKLIISLIVNALDDRYGKGSWFTSYEANKNIDGQNLYIKAVRKEFSTN